MGETGDAGRAFAHVVVDELARHGVTDAVLSPGSRSTPLALALGDDQRIRLHVRIDERSASFLALGLAKVSGRPVPVLCTSGTAAAEFHPAVLEADAARVPLLVLTADRPPELRAVGANQTVDQLKLYGAAVRWFHELGVPELRPGSVAYWRGVVSHAVGAAAGSTGASGPVHLNLPLREPLVPGDDRALPDGLEGRAGGRPWTVPARDPLPVPAAVAGRLASAATGVVVAGAGLGPADVDGLVEFADRRAWPLLAEPHSNARHGSRAVPSYDAVLRDADVVAQLQPEVVVVCGRAGLTRATLGWLGSVSELVVLDADGSWWDPTHSAAVMSAAAPAGLAGVGGGKAADDWCGRWLAAGAAAADAVDAVLDETDDLTEPRVARDLTAALPDGALLVVASSMPIRDVDLTMRPRRGLRIVANRGVSGIDGFVSTAAGAALAHRGPTWALAGDLSLLHDVNGLAADPRPDLTIVVVNNDGGGIFSLLPQSTLPPASFERAWGTPHGVEPATVAAAYGVEHHVLRSAADLAAAVGTSPEGVRMLEVRTERTANADLHRRLQAAAADAVARSR